MATSFALPQRLRRLGPEVGVAVGALCLNAWQLSRNGYSNAYYAAAVRSMTTSWHNFIYASYDAGGFITPDKPPFALWIQAASAKVFGYSSWSLLLPSAVAGALSVWLIILMVRAVWGRTAGLGAGVALALTPMMFAVSRSSNPDAILVLTMVAGAWAAQRALATDRLRWSALAGALLGLGFLTKMLAAAIVLPAIAGAVVFGLVASWKRRFAHLTLVGVLFVAVGAAWVALMDLSPNSPYVGGSTDGTARDLVFGYNGFGRVFGNSGPGGAGGVGAVGGPGGFGGGFGGGGGVDQFGGATGIGRLINMGMGDQVMWLSMLAATALVGGTVMAIQRRRRSQRAGALALFGLWAVVGYLLFAYSEGIFHNYYVAAIAPPLAALVGIGVGLLLDHGRAARLVAALAVAATAVVQLVLLRRVAAFEWLRVVTPLLLVASAVALAFWAWKPQLERWRHAIVGVGLGAALLSSAMWIASSSQRAESATFPDARPVVASGFGGPGGAGVGGPGGAGGFGQSLSTDVLDYLQQQTTTETWILAVSSSMEADSAIIDGYRVLSMGGFSGSDPAMSAERLAQLVSDGELRFISAGGGFGGFGGASGVSNWVSSACATVDLAAAGVATSTATIYDCAGDADAILAAAASAPATPVPTGGTGNPGQQVPGQQPPGGAGAPVDLAALASCLDAQGIDASTLQQGPPDFSDPAVAAAMQACSAYLPGGPGGGGPLPTP